MSKKNLKKSVLVVDDDAGHRLMLKAVLTEENFAVLEADNGRIALELLSEAAELPGVMLLDMRMPVMDGRQVFEKVKEIHPNLPVIMLTAHGSVESAVEAMKKGAYDYLTKPTDNNELIAVLERALEYSSLLEENAHLRSRLFPNADDMGLVGKSTAMIKVREMVAQVAPTEATVLILGESGTGKELVCEALHNLSPRRDGPLVKINCAALPTELLESELFGYTKGAFTGALKDKPGRFRQAHGGSIFLDEIGDMPMPLQAKLLRVLQERKVEPLGALAPQETDTRIISATNRDLKVMVKEGTFREDLLFRLNVMEIRIPPLRERLEDLPIFAEHLIRRLSQKNRIQTKRASPEFIEALDHYSWPGNVRELENIIERALILSRSNFLEKSSLPEHIFSGPRGAVPLKEAGPGLAGDLPKAGDPQDKSFISFEEAEKKALIEALEAHEGHRERTAQALGISRRALQYKLNKFGLSKRR